MLDGMGHSHNAAWLPAISRRYADWITKGGAGLVKFISEPGGRGFCFDIIKPADAVNISAKIYYITEKLTYSQKDPETGATMDQSWKTADCAVSGERVKGTAPADAHSYYVEAAADTPDGVYVSTSEFVSL